MFASSINNSCLDSGLLRLQLYYCCYYCRSTARFFSRTSNFFPKRRYYHYKIRTYSTGNFGKATLSRKQSAVAYLSRTRVNQLPGFSLPFSSSRATSGTNHGSHPQRKMSPKLVPNEPEKVMVIREVTPGIITLSVPFARFGQLRVGGRGTIGE